MAGTRRSKPVKNLYLLGIRLPIGGVVSILHRVSGALLVLLLPASLWTLQHSLASAKTYGELQNYVASPLGRTLSIALIILSVYHLLAGLRHLLLDIDIGISRAGGRRGAWLVVAGTLVVTLFAVWCQFT